MKRRILTALTAAALTTTLLLTGCGTSNDSLGAYIDINGTNNYNDAFRSDPDAALEQVKSEPEPAAYITLQSEGFDMFRHISANETAEWHGTFSLENNALRFSYAFDTPLNNTGACPWDLMPRIYLSDAAKTSSKLPVFLMRNAGAPSLAEVHGDFICVPTYGVTLEGSFNNSEFTLNYVPANTLRNDIYSTAYYQESEQSYAAQPDEDILSFQLDTLCYRYGLESTEDMQFSLTFSEGSWEMTAADGKTVSKGSYAESKKHPGFITMYEETDDAQAAGFLQNLYPLFLYIDGDNVYYPGLIKI